MSDVLPRVDSELTLDGRVETVLSRPTKPAADIKRLIQEIKRLIQETEMAVIAAGADGARRDTLQDAIKRLRAKLRELKAREDRLRLLAKIEEVVGPVLWRSSIEDEHGFWTPKAIVEAELYHLEVKCAELGRIRVRASKTHAPAIKQLVTALRKAKSRLPEDLRLLLGIDKMIWHLEAYEAVIGKTVVNTGKWKERLEAKPGERPNLIDIKPGKPKPDAYAKRMAALSAAYLCETFGIPLKTTRATIRKTGEETKASVFCRLAAVLHGDESANMQPYCREAAKEAARQRAGSKMPGQN